MGRHELREQVFKLIFRVEFNPLEEMDEQTRLFLENEESIVEEKDAESIKARYEKVQEKIAEIDVLLDEKAEGWSTKRMGKIELAILRLAVYEILFDDDIPTGVAINEAVEIAKKYGQDNSGSFVNAILAKFVN